MTKGVKMLVCILSIFVYGTATWATDHGEPWGPTEIDYNSVGYLDDNDSEMYHRALRLIEGWSQAPREGGPERIIFLTTSNSAWVRENHDGNVAPKGVITATILMDSEPGAGSSAGKAPVATAVFWDRIVRTPDPLVQLLLWLPAELYVGKYISKGPLDSETMRILRLHGAVNFLRELRTRDEYMTLSLDERLTLDDYLEKLKGGLRRQRQDLQGSAVSRACKSLLVSADN